MTTEISLSAQYVFVRGRQLEGTYPGDANTGIWPITAMRVVRGWGNVREEDWPYDDSTWPPAEPPGLDQIAIRSPDCYYQRVRTLDECKSAIARLGTPVLVSLNISEKWYQAPNGRIPECSPDDVPVGCHVVLVHGYDDSCRELSFQNSWGVYWGDKGHGHISYSAFETTWIEGWIKDLAAKPMAGNPLLGVNERRWGVCEYGGGILHCFEFVHSEAGKVGWTFFVERSGSLEVEEFFVMPAFRRSGYGARLITLIGDYARERSGSVKVWVSHADAAPENVAVVEKLTSRLGLKLATSPVKWASYVATNAVHGANPQSPAVPPFNAVRPSGSSAALAAREV